MHATSQENMQKCYKRYLQPSFIDARKKIVVLEMGSADVNGSYRGIFSHPKIQYCGADLANGRGVDLVLKSPYEIPLGDAYADVVISGQMLEHCAYFWLSFQEMVRVLKPDGLLFLIAPSAGPIHRFPVDCYRFYPDAYKALADLTGCHLVDSWLDKRGPWKDLVGVFSKQQYGKWQGHGETGLSIEEASEKNIWVAKAWKNLAGLFSRKRRRKRARHAKTDRTNRAPAVPIEKSSKVVTPTNDKNDPQLNVVSGAKSYLDLLEVIHRELAPRLYLEIGVRNGTSLALSGCTSIGIDPEPELSHALPTAVTIYRRTADEFFELDADHAIQGKIDVSFIDGLHQFDYVLRDFTNVERYSASTSLIVVDDIYPNHPVQAKRIRESRVWTGDVWKLLPCLRMFRRDLILIPVNTSPTGSLLIVGLDPSSRELIEKYNAILRQFVTESDDIPPGEILERRTAIQPDDQRIIDLLRLLRLCRDQSSGEPLTRQRLGSFAKHLVSSSTASY
jgi:SAM-dependent methyltransferase